MMQPPCKKCLLSELNDSDIKKEIMDMVGKIPDKDKVGADTYKSRLDVCRQCDDLIEGTCLKCGCYVELRAIMKRSKCPGKKWK